MARRIAVTNQRLGQRAAIGTSPRRKHWLGRPQALLRAGTLRTIRGCQFLLCRLVSSWFPPSSHRFCASEPSIVDAILADRIPRCISRESPAQHAVVTLQLAILPIADMLGRQSDRLPQLVGGQYHAPRFGMMQDALEPGAPLNSVSEPR